MTDSPIRIIAIPNLLGVALFALVACGAPPGGSPPPPVGDAGPTLSASPDAGVPAASSETCDNGLDDDRDGAIDEGCPCMADSVQSCFGGPATARDVGICRSGTQRCEGTGEFGAWGVCEDAVRPGVEVCDNGVDEDCDGADEPCAPPELDGGVAEGGDGGTGGEADAGGGGGGDGGIPDPIRVPIMFFGDCVTASCPPEAPYPVGCAVFFTPGDDRGCVASVPSESTVYFQAGDQCNAGFVTGHLLCSTVPGAPLDQVNCPINKPVQHHVSDSSMCPEIT